MLNSVDGMEPTINHIYIPHLLRSATNLAYITFKKLSISFNNNFILFADRNHWLNSLHENVKNTRCTDMCVLQGPLRYNSANEEFIKVHYVIVFDTIGKVISLNCTAYNII